MTILARKSRSGTIALLELGTNSLKLHLSRDPLGPMEPLRLEWDVGFEVYSSRRISEETIRNVLARVHSLLVKHRIDVASVPVFGVATGAFRNAENTSSLLDRLSSEEGVPVRVLGVAEEASLLIDGARKLVPERPGIAFDLGGDSLEMVYLGSNGAWLREYLPLGVIRLHHMALFASGKWDESPALRWITKTLQSARAFKLPSIHGTGGTVKSIAQAAGSSSIPVADLARMEKEFRSTGAPSSLSDRRRELFPTGLMVVRCLAEHLGARTLHYTRIDLGEVLLARLAPFRDAPRGSLTRSFLQQLDLFRSDSSLNALRADSTGVLA